MQGGVALTLDSKYGTRKSVRVAINPFENKEHGVLVSVFYLLQYMAKRIINNYVLRSLKCVQRDVAVPLLPREVWQNQLPIQNILRPEM